MACRQVQASTPMQIDHISFIKQTLVMVPLLVFCNYQLKVFFFLILFFSLSFKTFKCMAHVTCPSQIFGRLNGPILATVQCGWCEGQACFRVNHCISYKKKSICLAMVIIYKHKWDCICRKCSVSCQEISFVTNTLSVYNNIFFFLRYE